MHVVAQIGRDEFEIRRSRIEVGEVGDVQAARWNGANSGEVDRRFMLPGVIARTILASGGRLGCSAIERHILRKDLPGLAVRLELIRDSLSVEVVIVVVGHPLRRAAEKRQIVRFRGTGNTAVIRGQPVSGDQGIDVRRVGIADDIAVAAILHHDEIDVAERRGTRSNRRCA